MSQGAPAGRSTSDRDLFTVRIVEAVVDALLLGWIAWHISSLPVVGMLGAALAALSAGRAARMFVGFLIIDNAGGYAAASLLVAALCSTAVIVPVAIAAQPVPPSPAQQQAQRWGVSPLVFIERPTVTALDHPPSTSDADGHLAGTVDKYQVAGRVLSLLVHANLSCPLTGVLVGPPDQRGRVTVLAVSDPRQFPTSSALGPVASICDPDSVLTGYRTVDVILGAGVQVTGVLDGGTGKAVPVRS